VLHQVGPPLKLTTQAKEVAQLKSLLDFSDLDATEAKGENEDAEAPEEVDLLTQVCYGAPRRDLI
jgi:hypothetical protein